MTSTTTRTGRPSHIIDPLDDSRCLCGTAIKEQACASGPIMLATESDRIRKLAALGATFAEIAATTGRSVRTVARVVHSR